MDNVKVGQLYQGIHLNVKNHLFLVIECNTYKQYCVLLSDTYHHKPFREHIKHMTNGNYVLVGDIE